MLLINIDKANGLYNGTNLQVNDLEKKMQCGDKIFLPRMDLILSTSRLPFKFQRGQFSIFMYFAMTINKI